MFTLLYFPIMPVIFIFSGLSLFLMYWTVKATFIRTCRKPPIYNHVLNRLGFRMILFGIILNCILTPLFFGSQRRGEEEK